jgi:class 3 adenylate cyclase
MKCPRCQHENPPQAKFCLECGARFAHRCSQCGTDLPASAKFCLECGQAVGGPTAGQDRFGSPESYTPKHLAEKILTSKSALEGERKQVTVLFADLKGSLELLADRDPEEARKILDPVLERMMEAVHRYEGTVNQVMGDGIMALFGAPVAHEDHAVRACYAALRMQDSVKRYAEGVFRSFGVPVQIRVGLNSGDVVVRAIGSDLHMDYTAVGQSTHLAARMEQMAQPGTILVTPETLALAEGFVQVASRGPVSVKGLPTPIKIFELTGVSPVRSRLQAAASRGLTRFIGRDTEIEVLRQALTRAGEGQGQLVAVVGEPGVGKSRLVWEFTHSHRSRGWLVLETASVSYGKATTYFAVIELLRSYFGIEPRDDARKMREKVTGKLLSLDRALESTLSALLSLLDVSVEDPEWAKLDPTQRRRQTLDGLKRLLLRESQVQPVLLVVEDLHWIDGETQAWLDLLVESLPTERLLMLVNYRPEYTHGWGSKTYYQQVRLDALPATSAGELLEALLGMSPELEELKRLLIERTQGNPFFLEESGRALVETRMLTGERGAYRLAGPVQHLQLPATTQAILAARIDRLPSHEKRLLQTAAVIGHEVPFALLEAVAELSADELRLGLSHLRAAEFLYETSLFPELEYTFKHALTHEVAYGSLLQRRRQTLHASIVEAIERLYPARLAEQAERLAHHALRSEMWEKAISYLRQAGAKAFGRSAYQEAAACFEQALSALKHVHQDGDTIRLGLDLRFEAKTALTPLAEWRRISECLREAENLATFLGDQLRLGWVAAYTSDFSRGLGDHEQAAQAGRRALAIAEAIGDFTLRINANTYLGLAHYAQGNYGDAAYVLRANVESLTSEVIEQRFGMAQPPAIHSRTWLATCLGELGQFTEGSAQSEEGLRIAASRGEPLSLSVAHFGVGQLRLQQGDFEDAIRELERGLELSRTWKIDLWSLNTSMLLGVAYARSGRTSQAVPLLEDVNQRSVALKRLGLHSLRLASLSEAYLLAGRPDAATESAREALELARQYGERGCEAWVLHLHGEIALLRKPSSTEEARDYYEKALTAAERLHMKPLVARCHLALGRLYGLTRHRSEADTHLRAAIVMFRTMSMRFWRERTEQALGGLR